MPGSSASNLSRVQFKKKLIEKSKGAVQHAASALNVAASATQNVPYLGAISTALVEISKIINEVDACKTTWKAVMSKIQEIQTLVDTFRENYTQEGRSENELPDSIKTAFKDFEGSLLRIIVTMNDCKTISKCRLIFKRNELTAATNQCDKEVASALSMFQARLQIDQWNLQRDHGKSLQDIRNAVMPHAHLIANLNSSSHPALPPAPSIFFGRSVEVYEVVDLINHGPAHVAIVGAGGIGKTSIALTSIHHSDVQKSFLKRFFLSCEAIFTADSLVLELLKLFGLSVDSTSSRPPLDTLISYMQCMTSKCLLCLDNFETPWDSDRDQVESLLANIAVKGLKLIITSRDADRPRGIKWGALEPIQPLTLDAALETWDAISNTHDNFSVLLIEAVECIPLAVTLLAQLAQTESSEQLWASWSMESTKLVASDGSMHRLNNLELSVELSLKGPRLCACSGAIDFFVVLCMLPQGMPELRIPQFETAFGNTFPSLRSAIRVLKQCSLAYTRDGFLSVLSPIRQYTQSHCELTTPFAKTLFLEVAKVYMNLIPADVWETPSVIKEIQFEIHNISKVLDISLADDQLVVQKTIQFSEVCQVLGINEIRLLVKATSIAHKLDLGLEGDCYSAQGAIYFDFHKYLPAKVAFQSALDLHKEAKNRLGQANDLQNVGKLYMRLAQLEDAEQALQSALDLHKEVNSRLGQANDLMNLGELYMRLARLEDAEQALQSALDLDKEVNDRLGQANDLKNLGELYMRLDQLEDAEQALQSALDLHKEVNDRLGQANDLMNMGELYIRLNRLEDAEQALQSALDLHKEVNNRLGEANDLQNLGQLYMRLDQLEDAKQALQSALDLHKEVNNRLGQANDLQNLGQLYMRLNRLEDAEQALQSALDLHKEVNDRLGQAWDLQNLGELYTRLDRLEDAEQALQSALDLHKEVNDTLGQANDLQNLGELYMRLDQLKDAEQAFQFALDLHKEVNSRLGQANDLQNLGELYMRLDQLEDAEQALQSALDLHKEVNNRLGQANDLQILGELYRRLNQLEDAEQALQSALDLHKEVNSRLGQANDLQNLGELYMRLDQREDAEQALQSALDLHKEVNNRLGQANDLQILGELYRRLDQLEDAEQALQSALDLHKDANDRLGQAYDLKNLGELYMRLDQLEDAEQALHRALDLYGEIKGLKELIKLLQEKQTQPAIMT
ncbi:TPR-like protein [Mycena venus]|uniref:TPR-like protein n=1 Tax=Mycena venus TaxID=2733690 RepID=A0A8H6YRL7_9AGAR|nr:TPR-like protein [Mycena venus]